MKTLALILPCVSLIALPLRADLVSPTLTAVNPVPVTVTNPVPIITTNPVPIAVTNLVPTVVSRDAHERIWETTSQMPQADGAVTSVTNRYTELGNGICYLSIR